MKKVKFKEKAKLEKEIEKIKENSHLQVKPPSRLSWFLLNTNINPVNNIVFFIIEIITTVSISLLLLMSISSFLFKGFWSNFGFSFALSLIAMPILIKGIDKILIKKFFSDKNILEFKTLNSTVKIGKSLYSLWFLKFHESKFLDSIKITKEKIRESKYFYLTDYRIKDDELEEKLKKELKEELEAIESPDEVKSINLKSFTRESGHRIQVNVDYIVEEEYQTVEQLEKSIYLYLKEKNCDIHALDRNLNRKHWKNRIATNKVLSFRNYLKYKKYLKKSKEIDKINSDVKEFQDYYNL